MSEHDDGAGDDPTENQLALFRDQQGRKRVAVGVGVDGDTTAVLYDAAGLPVANVALIDGREPILNVFTPGGRFHVAAVVRDNCPCVEMFDDSGRVVGTLILNLPTEDQ